MWCSVVCCSAVLGIGDLSEVCTLFSPAERLYLSYAYVYVIPSKHWYVFTRACQGWARLFYFGHKRATQETAHSCQQSMPYNTPGPWNAFFVSDGVALRSQHFANTPDSCLLCLKSVTSSYDCPTCVSKRCTGELHDHAHR